MLRAAHAGSMYPTGRALQNLLDDTFGDVSDFQQPAGTLKVIISPHGMYDNCSKTAVHSFKLVNPDKYNNIVILGPFLKKYIKMCSIVNANRCETPLGLINISSDLARSIVDDNSDLFSFIDVNECEAEQSLEAVLPFVKYVFRERNISILPIFVGDISYESAKAVSSVLSPIISNPETLLIVTSTLCRGELFDKEHLPNGNASTQTKFSLIDHETMDAISTRNPQEFVDSIAKSHNNLSGEIPIYIAMNSMRGNYSVHWLHYSQHCKNNQQRHRSIFRSRNQDETDFIVSYASGAFILE